MSTAEREVQPVPRTALTLGEAARSIGVSVKTLRRHVLPTLKVVRLGTNVLIPVKDLHTWLENHGTLNTAYVSG